MHLRWFRFSAPGVEDRYGYGTESEAAEYVRLISPRYSEVPSNAVLPMTADAAAFSVREALMSDRKDWCLSPPAARAVGAKERERS